MILRKILSRRKHDRFNVKEKTYIVFQPFTMDEKKVQVIDISEGGCAFIYVGDEKDVELAGMANLVCGDSSFVERINFSKVRDNPIQKGARKAGVEFKWLGNLDKAKLKTFIQGASLGKC
jgi:c-di-GMP-binding flagellar brake protein YcgR